MRVHGIKTICRRTDVPVQTDYRKYKPDLRKDFYQMCGYCGKHEMVSHKGMEPDHFVPSKTDHSRKCDYSNLVYCCFTCNRKKLGKWPTCDKYRPHNEYEGFVDPATPEYDIHMGRCEDGTLEYYTDVGEYMFKTAFKFDVRPTKAIWQASQLYELMDKLKAEISKMSQEEMNKYITVFTELDDFQKYLFEHDE